MCFLIILLLSESVPRTREALLSIFNMEKTKSFKLSRFEKVGYVARRYDKVKMTSSVSGYIAQRNSIVKMTPPVSGYIAQRNDTVRNNPQVSGVSLTAAVTQQIKIKQINRSRGMLCPVLMSGLGNHLFQFASTFGIAMSKHMTFIMNKNSQLNIYFALDVKFKNDNQLCRSFKIRLEKFSATYDKNLLKLNSSKNFRIGHYLQSYKYFYKFRKELRQQLQFRKAIQESAKNIVDEILREFNITSRHSVTLIGVHVRRGDKVNNTQGYGLATADYLRTAVDYYKKKYKNTIFIVASNGMEWTKKNMPRHIVVKYVAGSTEMDMATIVECDHVIMTIGSYGWWCGWLAGGDVVYYKRAAIPGSRFAKRINYEDHFYPGWVGF